MPALPNPTADAYLRTQVLTASPEKLRLMLLDGAVRFARSGREGLAQRNFETCFEGFSRCRAILVELVSTMRPEIDPDLCARVGSLYTFLMGELLRASHERDPAIADRVIEILEYERETWVMLMEKLASERGSSTGAVAPAGGAGMTGGNGAGGGASASAPPPPERRSLSLSA